MSVMVVQVGQCGNQLGEALFETVYREQSSNARPGSSASAYCRETAARFFTPGADGGTLIANAVLVDMENKVVAGCLSRRHAGVWTYNPRCSVLSKQGSGNNWANGYCNFGETKEEEISVAVKVLLHSLPDLRVALLLMSAAGGTGSGLGCRITELIRDIVPGVLLVNQVVLPFSQGEVSVQGYNMLLTLSSLYQSSDALLLSHNDSYQTLSRRLIPGTSSRDCISFKEMNRLISSHVAGVLLPASSAKEEEKKGRLIHCDDIVEHLVPHPCYRLLTARMMPVISEHSRDYTNTTWEMLGKYSRQMLIQNSIIDEGLIWSIKPRSELLTTNKRTQNLNVSVSNYIVCRGSEVALPEVEDRFKVADLYRNEKTKLLCGYSAATFDKLDKSLFVIDNSAKNGHFLEDLLSDSWLKFQANAFIYQYEKFGLDREWFKESFNVIEKVRRDYENLLPKK